MNERMGIPESVYTGQGISKAQGVYAFYGLGQNIDGMDWKGNSIYSTVPTALGKRQYDRRPDKNFFEK